ncbi:hypothetical protein [Kineosporia sp. NBRC 101731]|uniref:hypothetical protein n=1 Tax=Kineosporia sp. NBRC 101731 TaxID=3032199 RepID=UPI0024A36F1E|nr:hypothetical protein [Kineosporia sp. NBRC 101731]GLY32167.1 hypothetical protein Kisp02_55320 [Kineosporia sp. NBRC 101731]
MTIQKAGPTRVPVTAWPTGSALPLHVPGRVLMTVRSPDPDDEMRFTVTLGPAHPHLGPTTVEEVLRFRNGASTLVVEGYEPLLQPGFSSALIHIGRERGLRTELVTSGFPSRHLSDLFLQEITLLTVSLPPCSTTIQIAGTDGQDDPIAFLRRLSRLGRPLRVQIPAATSFSDTPSMKRAMVEILLGLPTLRSVEIYTPGIPSRRPSDGLCLRNHAPAATSGHRPPDTTAARLRALLRKHGLPVEQPLPDDR